MHDKCVVCDFLRRRRKIVVTMGWRVDSLYSLSTLAVVRDIGVHIQSLSCLPDSVKAHLLRLLGRRSALSVAILRSLLYPKLRELNLSDTFVDDDVLDSVTICKWLQSLDLRNRDHRETVCTSKPLEELFQCLPLLQVLEMTNCDAVTDAVVVTLSENCPYLKQLDIGGCSRITDTALVALATHCGKITCLNVSRTKITDMSIICLVNSECHQNLFELQLKNCEKITDHSIEAITNKCIRMSILVFDGCPLIKENSSAVGEMLWRKSPIKFATWTCY